MMAAILVLTFIATPLQKSYAASVDDSAIEQQLKEKGLDKRPGPVEVPAMEFEGLEPTSGFVDDSGRALSDTEYQEYLKNQEKGIFEKYPLLIAGLITLSIIGIVILILRKQRRK